MNPIGFGSDVAAVAAGSEHTCVLNTAGGVKCWGRNKYGQLGDGTTTGSDAPVDVLGLASGVAAVSAGPFHTCAVTTSGGLKCWGSNWLGQVGDGTNTDQLTPVDVIGLTSGVTAVASGWFHSCALTTLGGVQCWGHNFYGQLGDGTTSGSTVPLDVIGLTSGVSAVSAGLSHTCAMTTANVPKCWGRNHAGQLGDGTTAEQLIPLDVTELPTGVAGVSAGYTHTCALTTSGGLKCWGSNWSGQVGNGTTVNQLTPVDVIGLTSGAASVSGGASHTCAVTTTGGLKCWGSNFRGQLGNGTTTNSFTPVEVSGLTVDVATVSAGGDTTCALTTAGGLKCWGSNFAGKLGDGTSTDRSTPADVIGLTTGVAAVSVGGNLTCALTTSGGVKCWGIPRFPT